MDELTLHVSVNGKESLDLNYRNFWSIGAGLFIVLNEHRIKGLDIHNYKFVHVKSLPGCFISEMSDQNVVLATKNRGTQQLVKICRLRSHGLLLASVSRIFPHVRMRARVRWRLSAKNLSARFALY